MSSTQFSLSKKNIQPLKNKRTFLSDKDFTSDKEYLKHVYKYEKKENLLEDERDEIDILIDSYRKSYG